MAKKKAVLIGCNYPSTKAELKGCVNDVHRVHRSLIELFGFEGADIVVLVDTDRSYLNPTGSNIHRALTALVESARPGDCLFVHYSGHGTRLPAETGAADDTGYDECIVPTDFNLITDEDFRELVCGVPDGCHLTIVSDSCHSGGLIGGAKEQIGESTKTHHDHQYNNPSISDLKGFLKQTVKDTIRDAFESGGMHIPSKAHASHHHYNDNPDHSRVADEREHCDEYVRSRSLPLSTLIEILKEKTSKEDIEVGKLRPTLFDIFREEASPKAKKFVKFILNKLNRSHHHHHQDQGGRSEILAEIGGLALDFLKQKLEENDEEYVSPVIETHVETVEEVYAGNSKRKTPKNGILLSGCQTDQTSADASPSGNDDKAYGAFSNAIQHILAETNGKVSNTELLTKARKSLKKQGFTQRPGLYCGDVYVDAPFICYL